MDKSGFYWRMKHLNFRIFIVLIFVLFNVFVSSTQIYFPEESEQQTVVTREPCPRKQWFHNETSKCYPSRKQGPCPESMLFYHIEGTDFGDCDCPRPLHQFDSSLPWLYDLSSNRCFKAYQQAFCPLGEWLILDPKKNVACSPNPCESLQKQTPELNDKHPISFYNGTCVRLGMSSEDAGCPTPYDVTFDQLAVEPICTSMPISTYDLSVRRKFTCRPGTRRDRLGQCRQIHQVSFKP